MSIFSPQVQPRGSGEALDEAGGHDAGPDAEALRQITLQQQSDLARLRTELQQARDDVQRAKEGGGQGNTVSEEVCHTKQQLCITPAFP